jgi:hypothetical protein
VVPAEIPQTLVAHAALLLWPFISLAIFAISKSLSRALICNILVAQLLLPVGASIKFQMVPQIDKVSIANFCAMIGCLVLSRGKPATPSRGFGLVEILLLLNLASPIITSELNSDSLVIGGRVLPGVGLYDAISTAEQIAISLIPFVLGRRFLRTADDCRSILVILTIAGLCYSVPLLFEIRFSPQLHNWVYGYMPTDFVQEMRNGGFRPMVFMGHGLLAAFFMMTSVLAATALWRSAIKLGPLSASVATPYLGLVLLLCKSMGATLNAIGGFLLIFFMKPKIQFLAATALVTISLTYPLLRSMDLVPTATILEISKSFSVDRAESLRYRFQNEDMLLERAFERPLFGWGRFGRSRVFDQDTGTDLSVTDGRWIIDIGQFGLLGFLSEFGLLATCVYRAAAAFRLTQGATEQRCLAGLALIASINVFDLLPNSGLIPWTWLLAGALLGRAEALRFGPRPARAHRPAPSSLTLGSQSLAPGRLGAARSSIQQ